MIPIKFKKLNDQAIIPSKRECDAGFDLYGIPGVEEETSGFYSFKKGITMIPTGIATEIPVGYVGILKERGSTGSKGLQIRCGVIDSGYRGEWFICIENCGDVVKYPVEKALAQIIFVKAEDFVWIESDLSESERGNGKLGSSGK